MKDFLHALRVWARQPGLTSLAVLSLGLGIGAITAVFSVVDPVLLRPLPYEDPERLVSVWEQNSERGWHKNVVSAANFLDWKEQSTSLAGMAAYREKPVGVILTRNGDPERLETGLVSSDYFRVLGVEPVLGRSFLPEEDWYGSAVSVIASYDLWQRRLGGRPDILGQTLILNGVSATVVGVAPRGFQHLPGRVDLWATHAWDPEVRHSVQGRRAHNLRVVARLKPGASIEQADAELQAIARRLEELYPDTNRFMSTGITPLRDWVVGDIRTPLVILVCAVGFVLLIACANVANLLLVRATARTPEMAIRSALGASRTRLVRQWMSESLVLSALGGLLGILFAHWGLQGILALVGKSLPRVAEVGLDLRVLAFTLVTVLLTAAVFGLAPAFGMSWSFSQLLREDGARSTGSRGARSRSLLVVVELALAVVLVISASLLLKSFTSLVRVDPGFDTSDLLTAKISLQSATYPGDSERASFFQELLPRLEALPGVESAAVVSSLPLTTEHWTSDISIAGRGPDDFGLGVRHLAITPDYFQVLGVPVLSGRLFTAADDAQAPRVALVNEALVRKHFQNENPLGKRISDDRVPGGDTVWWTIVGVVRDQKQEKLSDEVKPEIYRPFLQWSDHDPVTLLIRTSVEPLSLAAAVRGQVWEIDPDLAVFQTRTMDQILAETFTRSRFITLLLGTLATIALVQAAVGLYAILGYSVSLRTQEIGIRMALGGRKMDVLRMVLRQGMLLVAVGLGLGLALSFGLARSMSSLLYGVSPYDQAVFFLVPFVLMAVGLFACYLPARKAALVDPLIAMRSQA